MWRSTGKFIYIYLAGTILAFIWIFVNFATWCDSDDILELERKKMQIIELKFVAEKKQINILKRHIDELKIELSRAEERVKDKQLHDKLNKNKPTIYVVTPTYARSEQKAELTRLSYTLRHVNNIHWIIVEDADKKSDLVTRFLANCNVPYTHLYAATPADKKLKDTDPNWLKPRGVLQRNAAFDWIRNGEKKTGILYFADDDNTYDLQIFEEMRSTNKVSVWPVGLVGYLRYESPVIGNGKVVGWHTYWKPERQFGMDMAGFAINIRLLYDRPQAKFRMSAGRGNQESDLLTQLGISMSDLEPMADDCTKVLVWHTRTEKSSMKNEEKMLKKFGHNSNKNIEV